MNEAPKRQRSMMIDASENVDELTFCLLHKPLITDHRPLITRWRRANAYLSAVCQNQQIRLKTQEKTNLRRSIVKNDESGKEACGKLMGMIPITE